MSISKLLFALQKLRKQPVYLQRCALRRHGREAHDVAEVNGDAVESLGLHRLASLQLLGHRAAGREETAGLTIVAGAVELAERPLQLGGSIACFSPAEAGDGAGSKHLRKGPS